jgi:hypothetical protein
MKKLHKLMASTIIVITSKCPLMFSGSCHLGLDLSGFIQRYWEALLIPHVHIHRNTDHAQVVAGLDCILMITVVY